MSDHTDHDVNRQLCQHLTGRSYFLVAIQRSLLPQHIHRVLNGGFGRRFNERKVTYIGDTKGYHLQNDTVEGSTMDLGS